MIGFLRGEILECSEHRILLLVGGVGYQVALAQAAETASLAPGSKLDLHIHTHVREDALDLYGFVNRNEKDLFLMLLGVNGIGPKGALAILSGMSLGSLVEAILNSDHASLQKIPGVGKKTAERVVLELADVMKKRADLVAQASGSTRGGPVTKRIAVPQAMSFSTRAFSDAREALVQLGFREADVTTVLKRIEAEHAEDDAVATPLEPGDLVKWALKQLR